MSDYIRADLPYLIFSVKDRFFALSTGFVREMLAVPEITPLPESPEWILGVINIRGNVYKLIDMRTRLGMKSHRVEPEELSESLTQREQEHKNWINELENCIKEDREFTLGVDPHQCKFGQWYDNYKTDDPRARLELEKFEKPHKAIHATAEEVIALASEGKKEEALSVIQKRRNGELAVMIGLFASMKQVLNDTNREIAVITELEEESFALLVDRVDAVENVELKDDEKQSRDIVKEFGGTFNGKIAQRQESDQLLILVDPYWLGGSAIKS